MGGRGRPVWPGPCPCHFPTSDPRLHRGSRQSPLPRPPELRTTRTTSLPRFLWAPFCHSTSAYESFVVSAQESLQAQVISVTIDAKVGCEKYRHSWSPIEDNRNTYQKDLAGLQLHKRPGYRIAPYHAKARTAHVIPQENMKVIVERCRSRFGRTKGSLRKTGLLLRTHYGTLRLYGVYLR